MDEKSALVFYDCKDGWKNWRQPRDTAKRQYPDFFNHPTYVSANKNFNVQYNSFIIYSSAFNKCIDSEIFSLVGPPKNKIGSINFTPSFTPGYYNKGDGKDLGHSLEFKSELQFSIDLSSNAQLGFSYNHISNASLGSKNPGANSYMFNFMKQF